MYALDTALNYIFWIPLIVLPWLLYSWFSFLIKTVKRKEEMTAGTKVPGIPILLFGLPILLVFVFAGIIQMNERERVHDWLCNAGTNVTVSINGTNSKNPQQVVATLKSLHATPAHHSHPTKVYRIKLQGEAGSLTLNAVQDSGDPREFWIFSPRYRTTSNNEIGRIRTSIFEKSSGYP